MGETDIGDRFTLLASAIAGRRLGVTLADPGTPTWTDGRTVFIDPATHPRRQLESLVVQASLVGAGSLAPEVLGRLHRKPTTVRRYLCLEGHRALSVSDSLIPMSVRSIADRPTADRTDSAPSSLWLALGPEEIPDPPESFGDLRPRLVVDLGETQAGGTASAHQPPINRREVLRDLEDDDGEAPPIDMLSSPVGGGGPIGRFLKRLLGDARSSGSGAPGADAPTRSGLGSQRVSRRGGTTTSRASLADWAPGDAPPGHSYPEWDVHHHRYRPDWCTVSEVGPDVENSSLQGIPDPQPLQRALARLGTDLERRHRQTQGEEIDIDAAVESYVETIAGTSPTEAVYIESQRRRRDLSVLVLLDTSGSAGEPSPAGGTVHLHQQAAAAGLTAALHQLGDRVALYGFRSQGRSAVAVIPVKRFDDGLGALRAGLGGLVPGGFTRLGAAIRHGASTLEREGGTGRQLLVVVSDGFAYDHGYETAYGEADARRALSEARHRGIGCLCLSIGSNTDAAALRKVFGTAAHAVLATEDHLPPIVGPLFRAALGTAELQRTRAAQAARAESRRTVERRPRDAECITVLSTGGTRRGDLPGCLRPGSRHHVERTYRLWQDPIRRNHGPPARPTTHHRGLSRRSNHGRPGRQVLAARRRNLVGRRPTHPGGPRGGHLLPR